MSRSRAQLRLGQQRRELHSRHPPGEHPSRARAPRDRSPPPRQGVIVVIEAHGRGQPVALAQRSPAADRNRRRWHRPTADFSASASGVPGAASPRPAPRRRLAQQRAALLLVEDGEARRHAGLQRKALQQPLAEGVDGLHLEAAGRLDGDGEQLARALHLVPGRRPVQQLVQLAPSARASGIVTHSASRVEHALRHLGRRGLGIGQRQDALGRTCRPAAGAARAWSARASCRCRRWR